MNSPLPMKIDKEAFCALFGMEVEAAPERFHRHWDAIDTRYREPSRIEVETHVLASLQRAERARNAASTENQGAFEQGWRENLELALSEGISAESLRPRYFRPSPLLRYRRGLIATDNLSLEYDLFVLARLLLFSRLLTPYDEIYELGCGSCANLFMLADLYPGKRLHGLDWAPASVEIATLLGQQDGYQVAGHLFDMLHPDANFKPSANAALVTIHAMEQIGECHEPLLAWLLASQPKVVIHYEPIEELYDPDNLYDHLALNYTRRRSYLNGYLTALRRLEQEGRLELLEVHRPEVGGVYHEASLIVWRPC